MCSDGLEDSVIESIRSVLKLLAKIMLLKLKEVMLRSTTHSTSFVVQRSCYVVLHIQQVLWFRGHGREFEKPFDMQ